MSNLYPQLSECRSGALAAMADTCLYYYDNTKDAAERKVWHALALMCDDELRFRNPRRRPIVPREAHLRSTGR